MVSSTRANDHGRCNIDEKTRIDSKKKIDLFQETVSKRKQEEPKVRKRRGKRNTSENESSSSIVEQKEEKLIEVDGPNEIWSVAFLTDGEHIMSGGSDGKIRCWQVIDGKEAGTPMDAGGFVWNTTVSPDGKWLREDVECREPRKSDRVCQRTRQFDEHSGRLTECDKIRDRIM